MAARSPLKPVAQETDLREYILSWAATTRLMAEGYSFSGHERNSILLNTNQGRFADISGVSGFDYLDDARSLGFLDIDFDGDLDFWVGNRNAPRLRLMRNNGAAGNFLSLRLHGTTVNRDAIGARVEVHLKGNDSPVIRTLKAGEGFLSQSSKWLHFGLNEGTISKVIVRWPGGPTQEFTSLTANKWFDLTEGKSAEEWTPPAPLQKQLVPKPADLPAVTDEARVVFAQRPMMPDIKELPPGEVTFVNIWASWCQPCLTELADFTESAERFESAKLNVQLWNADDPTEADRFEKISNTLSKIGIPFPNANLTASQVTQLDAFQRVLTKRHITLPLPTSFLLDRDGNLAVLYRGPVTADQVLADLKLLDLAPLARREKAIAASGRWLRQNIGAYNPLRVAMRLFDAGETEAARNYLQKYLKVTPENIPTSIQADIQTTISRFEDELGHGSAAIAAGEKALESNPQNRRSHLQLANTHLKERNFSKAEEHFQAALDIDDQDAEVLVLLAMTQLGQGKLSGVEASCRKALAISPKHAGAHYNLAFALQNLKQPAEAISHYRKALELSPNWAMAANNLAWLLSTNRNPDLRDGKDAYQYANSLCQSPVGKQQPIFWMTLGAAAAELGRFDEATKAAGTALSLLHKSGQKSQLTKKLQSQISNYRSGNPWRE